MPQMLLFFTVFQQLDMYNVNTWRDVDVVGFQKTAINSYIFLNMWSYVLAKLGIDVHVGYCVMFLMHTVNCCECSDLTLK